MNRMLTVCLALTVFLSPTLFTSAQDTPRANATLSAAERADAVAALEDTRAKVMLIAATLSDEEWNFQAAPDRWSVAQVVEHLMLAEGALWEQINTALAKEVDPQWAAKTEGKFEGFRQLIPDRSQRFQAPAPLQPKATEGERPSRAEVVKGYLAARERSIAFARKTELPLKALLMENPNFGEISAYHCLYLISLHNDRHNQQIEEILADPGFPGS